ncbi:DUF6212 domain-containing protein [Plastorhodobacter daqingensis]|uniref:DUF6212 domain-containing protein n=1 Tax=Plastorhodobacter daqingensis TaxID=1387281 RepID=A0ABW2UJA5_9RHOB
MIRVFLVAEDLRDAVRAVVPEDVILAVLQASEPAGRITMPEPEPGWNVTAAIAREQEADQVRAALEGSAYHGTPVVAVAHNRPDDLARDLMALLLRDMRAAEADAGEARAAAAVLRRENMTLNSRFRAVESFLYALGNPEFSQALSWQGGAASVQMAPGSSLSQALPLNAVGIAAVDLWFAEVLGPALSDLEVALVDAAGVRSLLHPLVPDVETGWLRFALSEPLAGQGRDCRLELRWSGERALRLGLGLPVPDRRFAATTEGRALSETLALRVWKSLPGVRLPAPAPILPTGRLVEVGSAELVLPARLPAPALLAQPNNVQDHVSSEFWHNENAIIVHPSRQGAVCAIVRDIEVGRVSHVSALVNVGHARAPALNFCIGIAPQGAVDEDGLWQRRMGAWLTGLPAHGWGEVHAFAPEPIEGRMDLLLATALATDGPNDMSWGLFRGFRIGQAEPGA